MNNSNHTITLILPVMSKRKLQIVKGIKAATGMGVKEAKNFMDKACANLGVPFELELLDYSSLKDLTDHIAETDDEVLLRSYTQREINLYNLGAGEVDDYYELFEKEILIFKNKHILKEILNKLTKEQLVDLSKEIK